MIHFGIHDLRKVPQQPIVVNLEGATINNNNNIEIPNPLPVEINGQNGPIEITTPNENPLSVTVEGKIELKPFDEKNFNTVRIESDLSLIHI